MDRNSKHCHKTHLSLLFICSYCFISLQFNTGQIWCKYQMVWIGHTCSVRNLIWKTTVCIQWRTCFTVRALAVHRPMWWNCQGEFYYGNVWETGDTKRRRSCDSLILVLFFFVYVIDRHHWFPLIVASEWFSEWCRFYLPFLPSLPAVPTHWYNGLPGVIFANWCSDRWSDNLPWWLYH